MAYTYTSESPEKFGHGGVNNIIVGGTIASGDLVLVITHRIHPVSGTSAVTDLQLPYVGFAGKVTLLPTGVFTWTTAGNIGLAGTAVVGKALDFTYNPVTGKWYPSYIA